MFKLLLNKLLSANLSEISETVAQTVSESVSQTGVETTGGIAIDFTMNNLSEALLWFITGMVGIFMVIGIIIVVVSLLNKFGSGNKEK